MAFRFGKDLCQILDLLHVMAGVEQMKFSPAAEWDGAENGVVGDLYFVAETLLALG